MIRNELVLTLAAFILCGCEPLRGVVSETDINMPVDLGCVETTLRQTFGAIELSNYIDDGGTFPNGTKVVQFTYYRTEDGAGRATLDIGRVNDKTRVTHSFTGIEAELPQHSFPPAMRAMQKAGHALKATCNFNLFSMELRAVGQSVEALN